MHKDYYCAYHHTQIITSFCTCPDCLLPACSICVRLHSQEHNINKTEPRYENMTDIFRQISGELLEAESKSKSLAKSLIVIEKHRKESMRQLRELLNIKSKQLVSIFQQALQDLDRRIVAAIYQMDNDFIREIELIDTEILNCERQIQRDICGIESEQSLKTVISYFEEKKCEKYRSRIALLQEKVSLFSGKKIYTDFKKDFKAKLNQIFTDVISISQGSEE